MMADDVTEIGVSPKAPRVQSRRGALKSLVVTATLALAAALPAGSKGGVVVSSGTTASTNAYTLADPDAIIGKSMANGTSLCWSYQPTASQCISDAHTLTFCGAREARRIREGVSSSCKPLCPVPSLAQCQSQSYWFSLCGVIEEQTNLAPAPGACDDEDESTVCPPHPTSVCANKNRASLSSLQVNSGSVVPGVQAVSVIVPSSIVPANPDPSDLTAIVANGFANRDVRRTVPRVSPTLNTFRSQGTSVTYWGRMMDEHVLFLPASPQLSTQSRRQTWQGNRTAWNANDDVGAGLYRIDSCPEYVYEKYYDYSLFEDATRTSGADYRNYVDVAYGSVNVASSVGTRALAGLGLRAKDDTPLPVTLQLDTYSSPKNVYFLPPGGFASTTERSAAISDWQSQGQAVKVGIGYAEKLVSTPRPLAPKLFATGGNNQAGLGMLLGFVAVDPALHALLDQHPTVTKGFQYHKDMATTYPAPRDEELLAFDRMRREFSVLWSERLELSATITKALTSLVDLPVEVNDVRFDPSIFENQILFRDYWESLMNPMSDIIRFQRDLEADRMAVFGTQVSVDHLLGHSGVTDVLGGVTIAGNIGAPLGDGMFPGAVNGAVQRSLDYSSGIALADVEIAGPASFVFSFKPEFGHASTLEALDQHIIALARLDDRIERELLRARDLGCLVVNGPSPCDWSPREFAEAISGRLLAVREKDYQWCLSATGDDFVGQQLDVHVPGRFRVDLMAANEPLACLPNTPYPCVDGGVCEDLPYNVGHLAVERFPKCTDAYHVMVLRGLSSVLAGAGGLVDPETGELAPYESTSDSERVGDRTFGVGYSYGARWRVRGIENIPIQNTTNETGRWCALEPHLDGKFDIDARVFGAEFSLVGAGFETGLGPEAVHRASLEIVGVSLIDVGPTQAASNPNTFNVVFDKSKMKLEEFFRASQTFMVGPVPVRIAGGLAGQLGARAVGRAGSPPDSAGGCGQGHLAVEAEFAPFFGVSAFASAGVNAGIVEVGVKITLDIVQVSFPVRAGVRFQGLGSNDTKLVVTNDVDIRMSFLGGYMSGFVEVCFIFCEEFEATIFRWAPLEFAANLFHSEFGVRMSPLVAAKNAFPL